FRQVFTFVDALIAQIYHELWMYTTGRRTSIDCQFCAPLLGIRAHSSDQAIRSSLDASSSGRCRLWILAMASRHGRWGIQGDRLTGTASVSGR
ncbi:hypothetical protein KI387_005173, partial [Taxus chinensis]